MDRGGRGEGGESTRLGVAGGATSGGPFSPFSISADFKLKFLFESNPLRVFDGTARGGSLQNALYILSLWHFGWHSECRSRHALAMPPTRTLFLFLFFFDHRRRRLEAAATRPFWACGVFDVHFAAVIFVVFCGRFRFFVFNLRHFQISVKISNFILQI